MQWRGVGIKRRWAFPQLPWGTLKDPEYIITSAGRSDALYFFFQKKQYSMNIHLSLSLKMATVLFFARVGTGLREKPTTRPTL